VRAVSANSLYGLVPAANGVAWTLGGVVLYIAVVLGALLSLFAVRQVDPNWALLGWPVYGTLMAAASLGHPRLRVPFEVAVLVLSAYALAHPRLAWRQLLARPRRLRWAFGAAVLLFVLMIGSASYARFARSQALLLLAELRWRAGDHIGSLETAKAAVDAAPGSVLPLLSLGERQRALGIGERTLSWKRVIELDERVMPAHAELFSESLADESQAAIDAQLAALRELRFDDNRLYEWLWRRNARRPRERLVVGTSADYGLLRGVHGARADDGTTYRWTHGRAELRMPGGPASTLHLRLRGWRPVTMVRVFAGGQPIGSCTVVPGWSTCDLALPPANGPRTIALATQAGVPWPPDDYLLRGVALAEAWIE